MQLMTWFTKPRVMATLLALALLFAAAPVVAQPAPTRPPRFKGPNPGSS